MLVIRLTGCYLEGVTMIAHIISTGDEILLGDIIDSNSNFLCRSLRETGISVHQTTSVGDSLNDISRAVKASADHADVCIVTGGLGPTQDDVTAQAAAMAGDLSLVMNDPALVSIKAFFKEKELAWTRENEKQALLPDGSQIMVNANGTAPGFYFGIKGCLVFFLPGPPREMKPMFTHQVKPVLIDRFNLEHRVMVERVTVFMLKESALGQKLNGFESLFPHMILGIRVSFPTIEVKIRFRDQPDDHQTALTAMDEAKAWIIDRLGDRVVSFTGKSIVQEVARLLTREKKTLAVAESCTGGLISNMVTDLPGSSGFFLFSGVTYSNEAKTAVLGVKPSTLIEHGAVHEQTALEMARGARKLAGADYAVSTTGIAGPAGGTDEKPVGMVCIGLAGKTTVTARTFVFKFGDRDKNKRMFAHTALEMLRKHLSSNLSPNF